MIIDGQPFIDLVVATVGRTAQLERFLTSLDAQTYRAFRVIVVDQNDDSRVESIVASHETLSIVHVRSDPGLSRARNAGLRLVMGHVVAFPDDDCWYPPELLEAVVTILAAHHEWDGLSTSARGANGRPSSMLWDRAAGSINRFNVWRRAISFTVFVRRPVVTKVGFFNEELGVGAGTPWQAGEESDYLLRALEAGFEVQFEPSLCVFHESPNPDFGRQASRRAYLGGLGHGHVLRTHGYPLWFAGLRVVQLVAGSAVFLLTGRPAKARFYFSMAAGRARGWLGSKPLR